jgi:cysteinyl-tRNA synthetase
VLWKPSSGEEPGWASPWGKGRPGWHIECSAMSHELLGASFDIHGGGIDLQFPHHENEIAQSACAHPEGSFASVWMHNEMLQVEGKKMSKSLGNFFTVRDLLDQGYPGEVIRFVMLSTHYRKPMDWTAEKAREATTILRNIAVFLGSDPMTKPWIDPRRASPPMEMIEELANDLNTSKTLSFLVKYLKERDESKLIGALEFFGFDAEGLVSKFSSFHYSTNNNGIVSGYKLQTQGLDGSNCESTLLALGARFEKLRDEAKKSKIFSEVDSLKSALIAAGVEVRMSKAGVELLPGPEFDPAKLEALK